MKLHQTNESVQECREYPTTVSGDVGSHEIVLMVDNQHQ